MLNTAWQRPFSIVYFPSGQDDRLPIALNCDMACDCGAYASLPTFNGLGGNCPGCGEQHSPNEYWLMEILPSLSKNRKVRMDILQVDEGFAAGVVFTQSTYNQNDKLEWKRAVPFLIANPLYLQPELNDIKNDKNREKQIAEFVSKNQLILLGSPLSVDPIQFIEMQDIVDNFNESSNADRLKRFQEVMKEKMIECHQLEMATSATFNVFVEDATPVSSPEIEL